MLLPFKSCISLSTTAAILLLLNTSWMMNYYFPCLLVAEASSSSNNGGNTPFMVMSEITVHNNEVDDDDDGEGGEELPSSSRIRSSILSDNNDDDDENIISTQSDTIEDSTTKLSITQQQHHDSVANKSNQRNDSNINDNNVAIMDDNGGSGSGSDTDDDDEEEAENDANISQQQQISLSSSHINTANNVNDSSVATATTNSQPLRTLQKLQAMLDDSDYATHTVSSTIPTTTTAAATESESVIDNSSSSPPVVNTAVAESTTSSSTSTNPPLQQQPPPPQDKLWTSKDRAKYRRTRRTEKQRQQQLQQREQRAREIRDIQRQRIIREERERKELEELRLKQADLLEIQRQQQLKQQQLKQQQQQEQQRRSQHQQQMQTHFEEGATTDFTDDDTDGGAGFELPNNPVYLSDGETETDDFSEEKDDNDPYNRQRKSQSSAMYPNNRQQQHQRYQQFQPYSQYNLQPPPQQANTNNHAYPDYQRYRQPPSQQGQQPPYSPPHPNQNMQQYQFNTNQQQQQHQQQIQYEQNYAAWAQAAANGYFYPPPTAPGSYPQQYPGYTNNNGQPQQQQQNQPPHQQQQPLQHPLYQSTSSSPYQYANPQAPQAPLDRRWSPQQLPPHHSVHDGMAPQSSLSSNSVAQETSPTSLTTNANESPLHPAAVEQTNESAVIDQPEADEKVSPTSSTSSQQQMTVQSSVILPPTPLIPPMPMGPMNTEGPSVLETDSAVVIAGATSKITFDSVQKLGFATIGLALMSYCAVSPRTLPHPEYNRLFLQNISIVWLAAVAPIISLISVYDGKYNNINTAIGTFYVSLTLGYGLAFVSEVFVTTIVRLGVFKIWEPDIFSLTSEVPTPILPWVLREKAYKPKRITLFAADFAASCVASPIIEEFLKLKICQWTCKLPRNFKPMKVQHKGKRKKSKKTTVQAVRDINAPQVTNVNCYVVQMLAASLGLKLFDITRRILMYTKKADEHKHFFAIARGIYPIHELCGTMTALLLARRDVLGINLPIWKIVGPAILIHGLANFRGMKPIFKWNSSTPWSEMQLSPFKIGSDFSFTHLIPTSYAKIVWTTILCRVFGFCLKNYYLTGRQAMKRTTTYSGKLHAFDAKLQTDSFLKKAKKDQN